MPYPMAQEKNIEGSETLTFKNILGGASCKILATRVC